MLARDSARQDKTGRGEPTKGLDAQARDVEGDEEAAATLVADVCDGPSGVILPAGSELGLGVAFGEGC